MTSIRVIGPGRAGGSLGRALGSAGWQVLSPLHRGDDVSDAAAGADVVAIATPDAAVAGVAAAVHPSDSTVVIHLSGVLGLGALGDHPRRAVVHPLVALPDPRRGAERLRGAWFGVSSEGDDVGLAVVEALAGRAVTVAEDHWVRYHAAAVIASNHLVALLGQVERVAAAVDVPLAAYLDLARGSLDDVAAIGPSAALTGPVRRGDTATVEAHLEALPRDERHAYEALSAEAARLCP